MYDIKLLTREMRKSGRKSREQQNKFLGEDCIVLEACRFLKSHNSRGSLPKLLSYFHSVAGVVVTSCSPASLEEGFGSTLIRMERLQVLYCFSSLLHLIPFFLFIIF